MKKSLMMILAVSAVCFGCTLSEPPMLGEPCADASYYTDSAGYRKGDFGDVKDKYYKLYHEYGFCPEDYSVCATDSEGNHYCHVECQSEVWVYCGPDAGCVKPKEDKAYCGARGTCSSTDSESDNYQGTHCPRSSTCDNGECTCDYHTHMNDAGLCIRFGFNNQHCGDWDNACKAGEICIVDDEQDVAECSPSSDCNLTICGSGDKQVCINPSTSTEYCGADSTCTNYTRCDENQICSAGECKCKKGYAEVEGKCVLSCNDNQHVYDDICEDNDEKNCGTHAKVCDTNTIEGSSIVSCTNGLCVAVECQTGYLLNNGACLDKACENDDKKCQNGNDGIGVEYTCSSNNWNEHKCDGVSCNSQKNCGACLENAIKCEVVSGQSKLKTCKLGTWAVENCPTGQICASDGKSCVDKPVTQDCTPGTSECNPTTANANIGQQRECLSNGTWTEFTTCRNNASCMNRSQCGVCQNGTTLCEDDKLYTCSGGSKSFSSNCPTGQVCNAAGDGCTTPCTNGTKSCTNNPTTLIGEVKTCTNGAWGAAKSCQRRVSCNSLLTDCGDCLNGTKRCSDDNSTVQTCTNGSYIKTETCSESQQCVDGECVNAGTGCTDGTIQCHNNLDGVGQKQTCNNGTWSRKIACKDNNNNPLSCAGEGMNHDCGSCLNGHRYCAEEVPTHNYYYCNNGLYEGRICPDNQYCSDGKCESLVTDCTSDETQCEDKEGGARFRSCNAGSWGEWEDCTDSNDKPVSCENIHSCGKCLNASISCNNNDTTQVGSFITCTQGNWGTKSQTCPNNYSCRSDTACGDCNNNLHECNGSNRRVFCVKGNPGEQECPENTTCINGDCNGGDECTNGEQRCTLGRPTVHQKCENHTWINQQTCEGSTPNCDPDLGCIPSCETGMSYNGNQCCPNIVKNAHVAKDRNRTCHYLCNVGFYPSTRTLNNDLNCIACETPYSENSCCANEKYGCCDSPRTFNCDGHFGKCCSNITACTSSEQCSSVVDAE